MADKRGDEMRRTGRTRNVYARIAVVFAAPSRTQEAFRLPPSVSFPFPRDPFSIQYRRIHNARLVSPLSNVRLSSASGALAFSHRYRYYLKPHRVSSSEWRKTRLVLEREPIASYIQKREIRVVRLWKCRRVSWICHYCVAHTSGVHARIMYKAHFITFILLVYCTFNTVIFLFLKISRKRIRMLLSKRLANSCTLFSIPSFLSQRAHQRMFEYSMCFLRDIQVNKRGLIEEEAKRERERSHNLVVVSRESWEIKTSR